jgi:2-iminobutanoate/2-iminopropanoate deaminase
MIPLAQVAESREPRVERPPFSTLNSGLTTPLQRPALVAAKAALRGIATAVVSLVAMEAHAMEPAGEAVKAGRFVYVSGTRPTDDKGRVVPGGIQAQSKRVLDRLGAALDSAGSSLAQAASITVYLRNASDFAAMNEVYRGYWSKDRPARTTVVAPSMDPEALVEMAAVAIATGGERRVIHPEGWAASTAPYSYGILSGDTLFLAGLVSRSGKDNTPVAGDIKTQTQTVLDNGGEILRAAGMTHADVVYARVYITDTALFQEMNATYRTYFPKEPPARATVRAALMSPANVVEIAMVAVKGGSRQAVTTPNADGSAGRANPNLSSAIRAGDRLYLAGMLGNTEATKGDAAAQTRETLARLGRTLEAAGFGWGHVVDGVVYVTDAKHREAVDRVWRERFPQRAPASATVEVGLVAPDGLVEIMLTAVK